MTPTLQKILTAGCKSYGLPLPKFEYKFHPTRKWRFDAAWPCGENWTSIRRTDGSIIEPMGPQLAIECQGGLFKRRGQPQAGRHTQGAALLKEYAKLNEGAALGWTIGLFTPRQIQDGTAIQWVRRCLTEMVT